LSKLAYIIEDKRHISFYPFLFEEKYASHGFLLEWFLRFGNLHAKENVRTILIVLPNLNFKRNE
jgi:hypothetical protein